MSRRAPLVVLALVCGFIGVMQPLLIRAAQIPAEQRHVTLMQIPDVSTKALRGAKGELYRQADASNVLSYRHSEIFDEPATPVGGNPHGMSPLSNSSTTVAPTASKCSPRCRHYSIRTTNCALSTRKCPSSGLHQS